MVNFKSVKIVILSVFLVLSGCGKGAEESADSQVAQTPQGLTDGAFKKQEIGAYEEAVTILNRALALEPKFLPALYRMAAVYQEWDRRKEAIAAYLNVLAIDPHHQPALLGLAAVYSKAHLNDLAAQEYSKVAALRPDDAEIHFKIALEYWYNQRLPETAAAYLKVIAIDPDHLQAHLNLASVYERMKKWEPAIAEIDIALQLAEATGKGQEKSIAENKLKRLKGRVNMTEEDMLRKIQPPFN